MFGANKSFGGTSAFGQSGGFGTAAASSSFGTGTGTAFGTPATGGFGAQQQTPGNTSIFGGANTSQSTGLFGGATSTFGNTAAAGTGFSFGSAAGGSTSGGLFGSTQPQQPQAAGGLFGTPTTSTAFGAKTPGFGNASTGQTGGLFGSTTGGGTSLFGGGSTTTNTPAGGLFGSTTPAAGGMFGAANPTNGTTVKFAPPNGQDTMLKSGTSHTINTRHQCITAMKEYEAKSLEELRLEDYGANRKGPQQAQTAAPSTGLFGASTAPTSGTGFNFGATGGFGASTTPASTGGLFGQQSTGTTSLFGQNKSAFGATATTTAASGFGGFGTTAAGGGTSLFGQNTANKSLFGNTATSQSTGLFGTQTSTSGFGAGFNTGFGTTTNTQAAGGLFGNNKPGFGQTTNSGLTFGQNTAGGLLSKPATSTTGFSFGATSGATSGFGTAGNTGGLFGNKATGFGTGTAGFGTGLGTGLNTGSSLFSGQQNKPTLGLGTGFGNTSGFGGLGGTATNTGMAGMLNNSTLAGAVDANLDERQVQQRLMALASSPYGDSPLFSNLKQDQSKREEMLKPTNPAAQKAALNGTSQYKVSPRPTAKIKPKPIQSLANGKAQLFDGLDDEDSTFGNDTFIPRRSVKKLVIKNRSPGRLSPNRSQLDDDLVAPPTHVSPNRSQLEADLVAPSPIFGNGIRKSLLERESSRDREPLSGEVLVGSRGVNNQSSLNGLRSDRHSLDDTIEIMNGRNKALGEPDRSHETTPSMCRGQEKDQYSERSDSPPPHPAGIVLRRPGYYTIPPLEALSECLNENGDCLIENFTVGREHYGSVFFPGETNVAGLNLDEIVHFRRKEITVYPDDDNKPAEGEGLNKKAEVTLDCVWPRDKSEQSPIKDPDRLNVMRYHEKIEQATAKIGAKFIDYRPETGSWVFEVKHFSKYGLVDDSDDEDAMETDLQKLLLLRQQKQQQLALQKQKLQPSEMTKQQENLQNGCGDAAAGQQVMLGGGADDEEEGMDEREDAARLLLPGDQGDADMADITRQQFPSDLEIHEDDLDDTDAGQAPTSHTLAQTMGLDARHVQAMKASFFGSDEDEAEENEAPGVFGGSRKHRASNLGHAQSRGPLMKSHETSGGLSMFGPSLSNSFMAAVQPKPRESLVPDYTEGKHISGYIPPRIQAPPSGKSSLQPGAEHMLLPSGMPQTEQPKRRLVGTRAQHCQRLQPLKSSVLANRHHLVSDSGLFMSRSFRVGWGPNWTLVHAGKPVLSQATEAEEGKRFSLLPGNRSIDQHTALAQSPFQLTLEKVTIAPYASKADSTVVTNHEEMLETQLAHSHHCIQAGCPLFTANSGVEALHQHASQAQKRCQHIGCHPDAATAHHTSMVWDLCVALWGQLPGLLDDQEAEEKGYAYHMARREAVSRWLSHVAKRSDQSSTDSQKADHVSSIFSHLTRRQIAEACSVAQRHGDHRLALLLAESAGPDPARQMLSNQLHNWHETRADKFIASERVKVFAMLAGIMVWHTSSCAVNVCEDLDWKRCLAVHLWYMCQPNASISDALTAYDDAHQGGTTAERYACCPLPPYMEQSVDGVYGGQDEDEERGHEIRDTCYHLLKLYSDRWHALEATLAPSTSTCHPLDHRLSWHLGQVLGALDYTHISETHSATLCANMAGQLEALGLWHWAIFVCLHVTEDTRREHTVKELLCRHVSLSEDEENTNKERFILEELHVPACWIHHAKAVRAKYEKNHHKEAWHLLKSGRYYDSHHIILRHIAADAIINEEYAYLKSYLAELAPVECSSSILDWHVGGKVFLDYINLMETLDQIKQGAVSLYELERLLPEVTSLCGRVSSLPCHNAKDRLCQSEMAKKSANLLRSLQLLQKTEDGSLSKPAKPDTRLLAPNIGKLPMPEDYYLQELRELTRNYMLEISA